jgi:hypothetical protein
MQLGCSVLAATAAGTTMWLASGGGQASATAPAPGGMLSMKNTAVESLWLAPTGFDARFRPYKAYADCSHRLEADRKNAHNTTHLDATTCSPTDTTISRRKTRESLTVHLLRSAARHERRNRMSTDNARRSQR